MQGAVFEDTTIVALANHCPALEVFYCHGAALTDAALLGLAQGCPHLQWLDLRSWTRLTLPALLAASAVLDWKRLSLPRGSIS